VSSHPVFIVWKCVQGSLGTSCVGCGRISLLMCSPSAARERRRNACIAIVVPGPGPGPGSRSFGVKHCQLCWLYAVGADQVTNHLHLNIWSLHLQLQSQCVGNGGRDWLVWTPSSQDLSRPPLTVFVRLVMTFYVCPNYCVLSAITIIT